MLFLCETYKENKKKNGTCLVLLLRMIILQLKANAKMSNPPCFAMVEHSYKTLFFSLQTKKLLKPQLKLYLIIYIKSFAVRNRSKKQSQEGNEESSHLLNDILCEFHRVFSILPQYVASNYKHTETFLATKAQVKDRNHRHDT